MSVSWAVDWGDGRAGVDGDRVVPAASTIKVLLAVAAGRRFADGRLDPGEVVAAVPFAGNGALLDALPGLRPRLDHLVTLALAVSDNAATNVLLERIGLDEVTAEGQELGLRHTRVSRRMLNWDAAGAGRDNLTTAADLARLLRALVDSTVPDAVAAPILTALRASQHLDILGEVVPAAAYLGNKRGFTDAANHDCGLVAAADAVPIAVAVCSSPPASPDALRAAARVALSPGGARR